MANDLVPAEPAAPPARPLKKYEMAIFDQKVQNAFKRKFGEDYATELMYAKQFCDNNSLLQGCDQESIKTSVMNVLFTGLSLNPVYKEAYLVPRKGKCQLAPSYMGLIRVACSDGNVKYMNAGVVYSWDVPDGFTFRQGTEPFLNHTPNMNPPIDPETLNGKTFWDHIVCAYSIATYVDGSTDFVVLPKWKIHKAYMVSDGKKEGMPWDKWPEEQARKTVLKYHTKTMKGDNPKLKLAVSLEDDFSDFTQAPQKGNDINTVLGEDVIDID